MKTRIVTAVLIFTVGAFSAASMAAQNNHVKPDCASLEFSSNIAQTQCLKNQALNEKQSELHLFHKTYKKLMGVDSVAGHFLENAEANYKTWVKNECLSVGQSAVGGSGTDALMLQCRIAHLEAREKELAAFLSQLKAAPRNCPAPHGLTLKSPEELDMMVAHLGSVEAKIAENACSLHPESYPKNLSNQFQLSLRDAQAAWRSKSLADCFSQYLGLCRKTLDIGQRDVWLTQCVEIATTLRAAEISQRLKNETPRDNPGENSGENSTDN